MRAIARRVAGLGLVIAVGGCRAATRVADYPRVDLQVDGAGNRGYLVGTPPVPPELKTTRKMIHTDVEVPSFYRPKKGMQPPVGDVAELMRPDESATEAKGAAPSVGSYVVQKGDSLWSIAARKDVYGSATQWRQLFDANRDTLKSPNHLKVGMTLKVPHQRGRASGSTGEAGTTFVK